MFIDDNGKTRVAYAKDFCDVTITLTPVEWQDLKEFFEMQKKFKPSVMKKSTYSILQKLLENEPKLKPEYKKVADARMAEKLSEEL